MGAFAAEKQATPGGVHLVGSASAADIVRATPAASSAAAAPVTQAPVGRTAGADRNVSDRPPKFFDISGNTLLSCVRYLSA
jgi:hypothetical protein